jgi:hypothetical protein
MIANDQELQTTLERITWLQQQVAHLRKSATNPLNYRAAASGFLTEVDRMQREVQEYFRLTPSGVEAGAAAPPGVEGDHVASAH